MSKEKEQARYIIDEVPVFCAYDEFKPEEAWEKMNCILNEVVNTNQ